MTETKIRRTQPLPRYWKAADGHGPPSVSFEFFPPKTEAGDEKLLEAARRLSTLRPSFVSVTYGAGGSTRERTRSLVQRLRRETAVAPAAHLTCVGASRAEIDAIAEEYWDAGIHHLVALRGDPPAEAGGVGGRYTPRQDGYAYAADLVKGLSGLRGFELSVGAYPETHPEAQSGDADLDNLKRKMDNGATRAITQFFFEAEVFLRFRDRCAAAGIDKPIVPGILPVSNFGQMAKFAAACGTSVPDWLALLFEGLEDDPDTRRLVAVAQAVELCRRLRAEGVDAFHFYTLNRADLTYAVCRSLGVMPRPAAAGAPVTGPAKSASPARATAPARAAG